MPFGPNCQWVDMAACIAANGDKDDPAAWCAAVMRETEENCRSRMATLSESTPEHRAHFARIGLSEGGALVYKQFTVETEPLADRRVRFTITTSDPDRERDIVKSSGVVTTAYEKNPIVLFAHDYRSLPVGRAVKLERTDAKIIGTVEFATADLNPMAEQVFRMVKAGFLNAASIGFRPLIYNYNEDRKGIDFESVELLEFSIVPIPAHPAALVAASVASGIDVSVLKGWAEQTLKALADGVQKAIAFVPASDKAAEYDPIRWNRQLSKAFDVDGEPLQASKLEYTWVSRYLDTPVKDLYETTVHIPSARMGTFLSALEELLGRYKIDSTRNVTAQDREVPPAYETIQLNSTLSRAFLVEGIRFVSGSMKMVVKCRPSWCGLALTVYGARAASDAVVDFLAAAARRSREYKFLRGEAFSLSGEFLERGTTTWGDVYLDAKNAEPLKRAVALLNERGALMEPRGIIAGGPPGCLHADTPIYDPVAVTTLTVAEREQQPEGFHVWSINEFGSPVIARAERPWRYPEAEMLRLTFASERSLTVTKGHRFLTEADQGRYVDAGSLADRFHASARVVLPSIDAASLPIHDGDGQRSWEREEDSQGHYSANSCRCDGRLLPEEGSGLSALPSPADVRPRSHAWSRSDGQAHSNSDNHRLAFVRQSTSDLLRLSGSDIRDSDRVERQVREGLHAHALVQSRGARQSHVVSSRVDRAAELQPSVHQSMAVACVADSYTDSPVCADSAWRPDYIADRLVSVEDAGVAAYYDFHVPQFENYWACGFFHHNTGKTLAARAMMTEAKDATFIWISARDFYRAGAFGGIELAYDLARENAPSVVLMEDVDSYIDSYAIDLLKSTLDGLKQQFGIITLLTTNFPETLPKSLIDRPGRFHDILMFGLPDQKIRRTMLGAWTTDVTGTVLDQIAADTQGFSGAHLRELVHFADTIRSQDGTDTGTALRQALEKVKAQRALIDELHSGSRRSREVSVEGIQTLFKAGTGSCDRCGAEGALACGVCDQCASELHPWDADALTARVTSFSRETLLDVARTKVLSDPTPTPFRHDEIGWRAFLKARDRAGRKGPVETDVMANLLADYGFEAEAAIVRAPGVLAQATTLAESIDCVVVTRALWREVEQKSGRVLSKANETTLREARDSAAQTIDRIEHVLQSVETESDARESDPASDASDVVLELTPETELPTSDEEIVLMFDDDEAEPLVMDDDVVAVDAEELASIVRGTLADILTTQTRRAINELRGRID